ncbi:hypothetical protein NEOKW01_0011 [Nematocida sp. AWRm80]|nr:hypothetical protein NEOKW01_0011 [Nematocida sp. AWRm80]
MEECKDLFSTASTEEEFKEGIEQLREKLLAKGERIKEMSYNLSHKESEQLISILRKKLICLSKWEELFPIDHQLRLSSKDK